MCLAFLEKVLELFPSSLSVALPSFEKSALKKHSPSFVDVHVLGFNLLDHFAHLFEASHPFLDLDCLDEQVLVERIELKALQQDLETFELITALLLHL